MLRIPIVRLIVRKMLAVVLSVAVDLAPWRS
jgi:hypothetical protein